MMDYQSIMILIMIFHKGLVIHKHRIHTTTDGFGYQLFDALSISIKIETLESQVC